MVDPTYDDEAVEISFDPEAVNQYCATLKDNEEKREKRHSLDNRLMETLKQFLGSTKVSAAAHIRAPFAWMCSRRCEIQSSLN